MNITSQKTESMSRSASAALGRSLADLLARRPIANRAFLHLALRSSHLPEPRKLTADQVRECGPRSGLSYRLVQRWWEVKHRDGDLSPVHALRLLSTLNTKPTTSR